MFDWFNRNSKRHKQLLKLADQIKEFVEIDKAAEKLQATINKPFVDTVVEEKEEIVMPTSPILSRSVIHDAGEPEFKHGKSESIIAPLFLNVMIPIKEREEEKSIDIEKLKKISLNKVHNMRSMGMQIYHPHKYISYE